MGRKRKLKKAGRKPGRWKVKVYRKKFRGGYYKKG
jgi:hypothetical protein